MAKAETDATGEADSELASEHLAELGEKISKLDRLKQQEEQRGAGTGGDE